MLQQNIDEFYLFTDTSCNYKFYEHQRMKRNGRKNHTFKTENQEENMDFFLYEYKMRE